MLAGRSGSTCGTLTALKVTTGADWAILTRSALREFHGRATPGSAALQPSAQPRLHVRPFGVEDRVHHRVADVAVRHDQVLPQHPVAMRPKPLDRGLTTGVGVMGAELHGQAAQCLEGVLQQQQFGSRC